MALNAQQSTAGLEHQWLICMRKSPEESIILLEMNKEPKEIIPTEVIEPQKQLDREVFSGSGLIYFIRKLVFLF